MSNGSAFRQNTPLACLGDGNPIRLVSLWDIMNQFKAADFVLHAGNFAVFEARCEHADASNVQAWSQLGIELAAQIVHAANDCYDIGLTHAWYEIDRVNSSLELNLNNPKAHATAARHIRQCLAAELGKRKFLYI